MSPVEARLPRTLSTLETWGFGFTVLLFWLVVAPEVHETLGVGSLLVWLTAALAGIVVNLQIRRLALARPDAAGGSPVYVARLWADRPLVSRWSGLACFHSWAIVPPAITWILADLAVDNLALLGFAVSSVPIQLALLAAIYLIAFSGVRVLSVVHLFFLIPSLGLLLALGLHGVGWLAAAEASPGLLPTAFELPSWSAWVAGYFVVAYTTYGIETAAFESEHRLRRSDGTWLWVMDRGRVVARTSDGTPVRMVGATVDITQRKHLEGQLGQARKMESIGRLAGGVAHDFNNVLTAILGTAELLLAPDAALNQGARRDVAEIRDAALRAGQITQQLLAFGRRQQLRATVIEPNDAFQRVEPLLRRLIGEDVELRVDCHPDPGRIRADRVQLEQAIMNLALNARDAMPDGGSLTIRSRPVPITGALIGSVAGVEPGEGVELSVIDTGEGMDDATQARVFEPFFTTKEAGKGTGLGMAMVYGFARQSGGFVRVESAPGEGCTVRMIFPRAEGDPVAHGAGAPRDSGLDARTDPVAPGRGATILLAEDETGLRALVERILTRAGYRVLVAADGDEALALAARHHHEFDLLISDLVMPRMGGVPLAEALRRERPDLRTLFISGYPDRPGRDRPVSEAEGGPPAFLQKPFSPAELLREVHRILE